MVGTFELVGKLAHRGAIARINHGVAPDACCLGRHENDEIFVTEAKAVDDLADHRLNRMRRRLRQPRIYEAGGELLGQADRLVGLAEQLILATSSEGVAAAA